MDRVRSGDDELLTRLQKAAFSYFTEFCDADTGLVADTSRDGSPASIAVVGFALSCYPVGVQNGWMTRADAARQTLKVLRFFSQSAQSKDADATGYKGLYYHFLDMKTGKRVWRCELSLIDSALLIAGILVAGVYYDGEGDEAEIRALSDDLYRRADWHWSESGDGTIAQGWKPECHFLNYGWEGYNEATILYVLGLGSPDFALSPHGFTSWGLTYQWEHLLGQNVLYSGPLFTHYFSHAWIDFRGIRDAFMREKNSDYFQNTARTIALHREYGARNPLAFTGYNRDFWGVTARATAPAIRNCAPAAATAGSSAICRAASPMALMTVPSRPGRCWPRCPSIPMRRWPERAICWKLIPRSAGMAVLPAASIPRLRTTQPAGCRMGAMAWIRVCL